MKKIVSFVLVAVTALGLAFGASASDSQTQSTSLYNANEISFVAQSQIQLGNKTLSDIEVGAEWFPGQKYLGVAGTVPVYYTDGKTIQDLNAGLKLRLPIGIFAPYLEGGANYNWQSQNVSEFVGGGLEVRFVPKWGIFAGVRYPFNGVEGLKAVAQNIKTTVPQGVLGLKLVL